MGRRRKRHGLSPIKLGSFLFKNARVMFEQRRTKRAPAPQPQPQPRAPKPWLQTPHPGSQEEAMKSPSGSILWMRARLHRMRQKGDEETALLRTELENLAPFWDLVEGGPPPYELGEQEYLLVKAASNYLELSDQASQLHVVPFLELICRGNQELRQTIFASAPHLRIP